MECCYGTTPTFQETTPIPACADPGTPDTPPGTTPRRPVPCSFSLLITDLAPCDLTALLEALQPDNDADPGPAPALQDRPCICPHCGHRHGGYDQQASLLLDCLLIAKEALEDAQAVLEREVLP